MTQSQDRNLNIEVLEPLVLMSASSMNCEGIDFLHGDQDGGVMTAPSYARLCNVAVTKSMR